MRKTSLAVLVSCVLVIVLIPGTVASGISPGLTVRAPGPADRTLPAPQPPGMPPQPGQPLAADQGRVPGAYAKASPMVVHPGGKVTLAFGGGPDVRWHMVSAPGALSAGCSNSMQGTGSKTCIATISSADLLGTLPRWLTFQVGFDYVPSCSPGGCVSTSTRDYIALLPASSSLISGSVRDGEGRMVRGVPITITGRGKRYATATDGAGLFTALLPQGTWTVTPSGTWDPPLRVVALGAGGARADFKAPVSKLDFDIGASRLVNGLDWTTAPATGLTWLSGVVRAHSSGGRPLGNRVVQIDAPYFDGSAPGQLPRPRISLCDAVTWRPLFTTGDRTERVTDSAGEVPFTMMLGTEIGTSLLHARLADDAAALDVERIDQRGAVTGPSVTDIVTPMQNAVRQGLPAPPLFALSAGSLQSGLVEWWLAYRSGDEVGPARMLPAGDFVPVRTADGSRAAVVFYPAGQPGPLRDHLSTGTALPADYSTLTLSFRQVPFTPNGDLLQWQAVLTDLPPLPVWEAANGPATAGFALGGILGTAGWLGGPLPPVVIDRTARAAYARCVPDGSPPATTIEVHSPITVGLPEGSGGFAIPASAGGPSIYVVPTGTDSVRLRGTGAGRATIVVRSDDDVRTYAVTARPGLTGDLQLSDSGDPSGLTFGGRSIAGAKGVVLRMDGLPRSVPMGRTSKSTVRVTDGFGAKASGVTVTARGSGIRVTGLTDRRGRVTLVLKPTSRGRVNVNGQAPGSRPVRVTLVVR